MSLCLKASKAVLGTNDTFSKWWLLLLLLLLCIYITFTTVSCYIRKSAAYSNKRKLFVLPQKKLRPGEFKELLAHDRPAPVCQIWDSNPGWPASMSGVHACVRMLSGFSHVCLFSTPWTLYGILQEKILEWVAMPFSRGSSWLRAWTHVSWFAGGLFICWAVWEAQPRQILWIIQSKSSEWHRRTPSVCLSFPLSRAFSSSSVKSSDSCPVIRLWARVMGCPLRGAVTFSEAGRNFLPQANRPLFLPLKPLNIFVLGAGVGT